MITAVVIVRDDGFHIRKNNDPAYKHCTIPIVIEYLAEGGANVVLRFVPFAKASRIECPRELRDKLIRIRKDKGFIAPTQEQQRHFTESIAPLFDSKHLVEPLLVTVDRDLLIAVNKELAVLQQDGIRPPRREGDTVAEDETHAVLMNDMTPFGTEISLEIKPKWLVQSPDAPSGSTRCRTCALRARRARHGRVDPEVAAREGYCPLALLSEDEEARLLAATAIMKANKTEWMSEREKLFLGILPEHVQPILEKIRDYQIDYDQTGILSVKEGSELDSKYLLAMTLRDCAMFIRAPQSLRKGPIEVRLADLDAKKPHPQKVTKWRETERALIEEGWYENRETDGESEKICLLSKTRA